MKKKKHTIDPKDLMAVERATTALIGTAISLIVLGFVVEKFELFLDLFATELKGKETAKLPVQVAHAAFYNYLGIAIIAAGIILSLYTYRYYTRWVCHLEEGRLDTDKNIYLILAIFIALIGVILLASMIVL